MRSAARTNIVIPAEAGISGQEATGLPQETPAFAGVTNEPRPG
jgi:hypothetical protein